jgi:hypothetical protein
MIVGGGLFLGLAAVGAATDTDELLLLGLAGATVDGMFVHAGRYYSPKAWAIGLGKGLLSVALRGGLATGACFIGSGCEQVSDGALLRTSIGILAGGAIDVAFLAYEAAENDELGVTHRDIGQRVRRALGRPLLNLAGARLGDAPPRPERAALELATPIRAAACWDGTPAIASKEQGVSSRSLAARGAAPVSADPSPLEQQASLRPRPARR